VDSTDDPFPSEVEVTRQFPGYRILQQISQTPMSSVYLAEEVKLKRRVVLKVLNLRLANDPSFHERFRREVAIAARLDHPNVIPVYASGESQEGVLYLVLRYVHGGDLGSLLRAEGRFDTARTAHFIGQMAAALDAAHRVGLVHRDVKPSNVLVDEESGHVYLCDFGIAKQVNTAETITGTHQFVGTPDYAAPEQIRGETIDRRADIYALGCVLFQCLTGNRPFGRPDSMAVLWAHLQDPPPRVTAFRPDVPPRVDAIVARALAKRPEERHASCMELVAELNDAIAGRPAPAIAPHPVYSAPTYPQPARQRTWELQRIARGQWWLLCAAAVAVVLLVAGIIVGVRSTAGVDADTLALVPAALRGNCTEHDPESGQPAAARTTLTCLDGSGQQVAFSVFGARREMLAAYDEAVRRSGIARSTGDCSSTTGAEHRYPAVGAPTGRLLCFARGAATSLVWTDDRSMTLARADSLDGDDFKLLKQWNTWTSAPAYPAPEEKALVDVLVEDTCQRAPAGSLDRYSDVIAAVTCEPDGEGADQVTYYRFSGLDALRRSHRSHVVQSKASSTAYCPAGDAKGTLANSTWNVMFIDVGQVMCLPGQKGGRSAIEWTDEPMRFAGRAEGSNVKLLADWWRDSNSPTLADRAKAMNALSRPVFPTPAEAELLKHVPSGYRDECVRPPERDVRSDVPKTKVTAVVCPPDGDPRVIYYYQFPDVASMRKNYGDRSKTGRDCDVKNSKAVGDSSYSIDDKTAGRLWCDVPGDDYYMTWTDEVLKIQTFAFDFGDLAGAYKWWQDIPGPVRDGD
jgi:eukaryotic-like serine/threonine-protein kinase